jgi:hypothetical protein
MNREKAERVKLRARMKPTLRRAGAAWVGPMGVLRAEVVPTVVGTDLDR